MLKMLIYLISKEVIIMILGICGKSCSGKSTLSSELLSIYGSKAAYLDIDKVGHEVLELKKVQRALVKYYGSEIIENGEVNRKKLGEIVFKAKEEMQRLTNITWPFMQDIIDNFIDINRDKIIILDWLLLPKTKFFDMCDKKVFFDIPYEIRKERAIKRDKITDAGFALRDSNAPAFDYDSFDIVLKNNEQETIEGVIKLL